MDRELWLTDEEIWGKEPTETEKELSDLQKTLRNREEIIEQQENTIKSIKNIIDTQIKLNIHKTRTIKSPSVVKQYREQLLILREIEKELNEYNEIRKEF